MRRSSWHHRWVASLDTRRDSSEHVRSTWVCKDAQRDDNQDTSCSCLSRLRAKPVDYKTQTVENRSTLKRYSHNRRFAIAERLLDVKEAEKVLDYGAGNG